MYLYVDKNVDLMRSTFIAVGLAKLLYQIPPAGSGQQVRLRDRGSCYEIESTLSAEVLLEKVHHNSYLPPLLPAIQKPLTSKEQKQIEVGMPEAEILLKYVPHGFAQRGGTVVDYAEQKSTAEAARKQKKTKNEAREEEDVPQAHPDYPVWAHLAGYFGKGSALRVGYPSVLHGWHAHQADAAPALLEMIFDCYGDFPNNTIEARAIWDQEFRQALAYADYALTTDISALAVVSPSTSKGVSAAAGHNTLSEGTPNEFWLEMYFAFAGFMEVAMPFNLGSDVITYYPLPQDINYEQLHDIIHDYRDSAAGRVLYRFSNGTVRSRLDALAHITFFQRMVENALYAKQAGIYDLEPDAISGLIGFYYKNISTQIPFDETLFALPAWLPHAADIETLQKATSVLEQHRRMIEAVRGVPPKYKITSDELQVLEHYRRYAAQGRAQDWIDFAIAYGMYRFRVLLDAPRMPFLTYDVLKESLPMKSSTDDRMDFRPILEDTGFQNIAAAINYCTVYARYKKDVQRDNSFNFKVRHGTGDDLLRNAHDPARFIADLSEFVHDYQQESSSVQARSGKGRPAVQPTDLHAIAGLIAKYGSRTVAHLLVAAGYASNFTQNENQQNKGD